MEKQQSPSGAKPDLGVLKVGSAPAARDVDFGQVLEMETSPAMEKKVLRKLDFFLIPLMGGCYMLQYIDKLAISQATLFNLREDLVRNFSELDFFHTPSVSKLIKVSSHQQLKGSEYNWASAIFYFGYFAWSWPSSYLIVR